MSRLDDKYSRTYDRMVRLGYDNSELEIMFADRENVEQMWDWLYESGKDDIDRWLKDAKDDLDNTED